MLAFNISPSQSQHASLSYLFSFLDNNNLLSPWIFFSDYSTCRRSNFLPNNNAQNIGGKKLSGSAMRPKTNRWTWRKFMFLCKSDGTILRKNLSILEFVKKSQKEPESYFRIFHIAFIIPWNLRNTSKGTIFIATTRILIKNFYQNH